MVLADSNLLWHLNLGIDVVRMQQKMTRVHGVVLTVVTEISSELALPQK